ncbi:hypothetical protein CKY10_14020 [Photorhabdus sp. HUG-39]|nr:hypothetical protein CKY10_14020 [Photorhabdus sp. HUG-39]
MAFIFTTQYYVIKGFKNKNVHTVTTSIYKKALRMPRSFFIIQFTVRQRNAPSYLAGIFLRFTSKFFT